MKTLMYFCVVTVLGCVLLSFSFADNSLTLDQAIADKKVQTTLPPFGDKGYSDGLRVNIKNISGKTLHLVVPKGTIFIPDNSGEQTLVTSDDTMFALNVNQQKQILRKGFCTELHDHGSDAASTFTLSTSRNEKLLNILRYMDSLKMKDEDVIQYAVWSITDNNPVSDIESDDTAKTRLIRQRICSLTAQKMPWYSTQSDIVQTPQREFVIVRKEVEGNLTFKSQEPVNMQGVVKDSTGKVVWTNPNKITAPAGHNITFWYRLQVEGWDPGKYYVVYTNNGKSLINQEFEI